MKKKRKLLSQEALELRIRMLKAGVLQKEVAKAAGMTESSLSDYFRGRHGIRPKRKARIDAFLTQVERENAAS